MSRYTPAAPTTVDVAPLNGTFPTQRQGGSILEGVLSDTPLAAGATYTGATFQGSANEPLFDATVASDQAGTLYLDARSPGTGNFYPVASVAVPAASGAILSLSIPFAPSMYYRYRYVNGATAQTDFILTVTNHS